MSAGATSGDRDQQKHDNNVSRRQSGLEPRPEDREEPKRHAGQREEAEEDTASEDREG